MSTEADIVERLLNERGGATWFDDRTGDRIGQAYELAAAEITKLRAERDAKECLILELRSEAKDAARDMRERTLAEIEKLRINSATNFKDANCQGQRGVDRADALYDAYHAVRALPLIATEKDAAT